MDKMQEIKKLLDAMKAIGDMAREINPDVYHVTAYSIDNGADIVAWVRDESGEDKEAVINAHMFRDGSYKIGDYYFRADGTIDFALNGGVSA